MKRPFHDTPPPIAPPVPPAERRVALVIGNGRYQAERDALTNPPNDATAIAAALTRIGFFGVKPDGDGFSVDFGVSGVAPILDLDNKRLGLALAALARAGDGVRQAVIYYAGHGIEVGRENFLIPVDARLAHIKDAEFETQPLSRALGTLEGATGLKLVILDACRNNPFRSRLFAGRELSRGLRSVEPPGNVLVAYAAKHGTTASDGAKGTNSPFAAALLAHIEKPGLEVVELFREVKDDVLDATDQAQEPYLYGSLGRRREYFVPPLPEQPVPVQKPETLGPVDDRTLEHSYWQSVKDSRDPAELESFLDQFPAGVFAQLAGNRAASALEFVKSAHWLRRLMQRFPDSPRRPWMRARLAEIEWHRLRKNRDRERLLAFAAEVDGLPEAELARQRASAIGNSFRSLQDLAMRGPVLLTAGFISTLLILLGLSGLWQVPLWLPEVHPAAVKKPAELPMPKAAVLPDVSTLRPFFLPPTQASNSCAGIQLEIAGKGTDCLDSARADAREFEDCRADICGPRMVVLPTGSYKRGSPDSEPGRYKDEGPVREVTIGYHFAVSKFEVTFAEWDACVADGDCKHKPDTSWGRGRQPVHSVSWTDITTEYLPWLNRKLALSGAGAYRLLTETEWEYAARAGTTTAYNWGETFDSTRANDGSKTVMVGRYPANPWGLHDMHGNVWEWVQDCYAETYKDTPVDGSTIKSDSCVAHVLRGGSWSNHPLSLRSAFRGRTYSHLRSGNGGFRLARTLQSALAPRTVVSIPEIAVRSTPIAPQFPAPRPIQSIPAQCSGIRTDVVGKGNICLDPARADSREFEDCGSGLCGPRMVGLPTGKYKRGSTDHANEQPVREVTIGYHLAVGKFEVTFDEWDACLSDGGCMSNPKTWSGRGRQPVHSVSWNNITTEYLPWLNRKLGLSGAGAYRLLTEAEWEYAARAGTMMGYSWGDTFDGTKANNNGSKSAPVGQYAANPWGLHDMHGNVWEWVEDCYIGTYKDAPSDGSAVKSYGCVSRVLRGGSWNNDPLWLRSSKRDGHNSANRSSLDGFRVARTLLPSP